MKKLLFFLCVVPLFSSAQFNGDYYAFFIGPDPQQHLFSGIASVNSQASEVTMISQFENTSHFHDMYIDHAVDPIHGSFFVVADDSVNQYLLQYDIDSGTLKNILFQVDSIGPGLPGTPYYAQNTDRLFYNCADGMLYFCHFKMPWEQYIHLAKVNPLTADVTEVDSFLYGSTIEVNNVTIPSHQIAYFLAYDYNAYAVDLLLAYDLVTNSKDTVLLSMALPYWDHWYLTYNPNDGMLYGIQDDLDSFVINNGLPDLRFLRIDPLSGVVTYLTPAFLGWIPNFNVTVNTAANQVSGIVWEAGGWDAHLATYDIASGTYTLDLLTYSNFGNMTDPQVLGIDGFLISKDCPRESGVADNAGDCTDPASTMISGENPGLYIGCHWMNYLGMRLQVFDLWGRKISDQLIKNSVQTIRLKNDLPQLYFYSITNQNQLMAAGKVMIEK